MTYGSTEVLIKGVSLNTGGLSAYDLTDDNTSTETIQMLTLEGMALNSQGVLWPIYGIWNVCEQDVTTNWTECP